MGIRRLLHNRVHISVLCLYLTTALFTCCDARTTRLFRPLTTSRKLLPKNLIVEHLDIATPVASTNTEPYGVNSPFSLPPFESLSPMPLPENTPPFCENPPSTTLPPPSSVFPVPAGSYTPSSPPPPAEGEPSPTTSSSPPPPSNVSPPVLPITNPPQSPDVTNPSPSIYIPSPDVTYPTPSIYIPSPDVTNPSPSIYIPSPDVTYPSPSTYIPSPSSYIPSPSGYTGYTPIPPVDIPSPTSPGLNPPFYEPSPPSSGTSPPSNIPSPDISIPSPPVFQPPVVYPQPPPHRSGSGTALWCVAKPAVPDPIIQEAMNYACGSGADCDSLQPSGSCFHPNTLLAHASYAFNSYWQRSKVAGGTCEFGGTAILVTVDPSYDGCHFTYF